MHKRLKKALVESFVGAIAIGWAFGQGILYFANIFSAPVANWLMRREYHGLMNRPFSNSISFQDALPDVIRSLALLLVGYDLLRWLYFAPTTEAPVEARENQHVLL